MFGKDSADTQIERLYGFGITHSCRDHEESSLKAPLPGLGNELKAPLFPEVIVQQDEINGLPAQDIGGFTDRCAKSCHHQIGLALQQPAEALSEERVIVQ